MKTIKWIKRSSGMLLVSLCVLFNPAAALDLPAFDQKISVTVREQPVQQFLETLFAQIRVPVVVSEEIEGLMNGKFEGPARRVFAEVAQAFNVTLYYDGAVAHVYSANEITRTVMPVSSGTAERVEKIANRMNLGDSNNRLDSSGGGGLMVTGTRRFLEQVEELSFSVQANAKTKKAAPLAYRVFYLSNAWAADTSFNVGGQDITISGVATLLKELVADGRLPASTGESAPSRSNNTLEGLRGKGLQAVNSENAPQVNTQNTPQQFTSSSTGARIVADSRLNAIIIRDTADRMPAYQELISDLDRPSQMVEIEATIIDVNTDKTRELGVGWQYRRSDGELSLIGGAGAQSGLISPSVQVQGPGAILSTVLGGREQFLARIKALEEKGAARVVSKPHVITLSDVEAVLGATTEFFVRVAGTEDVDLFNVPVGTTLRVTPHVFQESGTARIKLLVNIEDGAASAQQVDQIPVVERANINTQAVINEGDSLLIGGLVRDSYQQVASSVPLLGSIPVLGRLFKSTANQSSRVERLFMITPRTADGLGFGRVHNGRRALPVLQGDAEDIESQAVDRVIAPDNPFGKKVDDIPFKPLQLPEREPRIDEHTLPRPGKPAAEQPRPTRPEASQQWVAIPGTAAYPKSTPADSNPPKFDEWVSIPVSSPTTESDAVARQTAADDDGWLAIE